MPLYSIFVHFPSKIINTAILWRHFHDGGPYADAGASRVQKYLVVRTWSTLGLARVMKVLRFTDRIRQHICRSSSLEFSCSFHVQPGLQSLLIFQHQLTVSAAKKVFSKKIKKQWFSQTWLHRQWLCTLAAPSLKTCKLCVPGQSLAFPFGWWLMWFWIELSPEKLLVYHNCSVKPRLRQSTIASCLANKKRQVMLLPVICFAQHWLLVLQPLLRFYFFAASCFFFYNVPWSQTCPTWSQPLLYLQTYLIQGSLFLISARAYARLHWNSDVQLARPSNEWSSLSWPEAWLLQEEKPNDQNLKLKVLRASCILDGTLSNVIGKVSLIRDGSFLGTSILHQCGQRSALIETPWCDQRDLCRSDRELLSFLNCVSSFLLLD